MKALDLFCGLGGWSDGLAAEGFDVTGVEIEPKIAALYKHRVIVSDVCNLNPEDYTGYDLIVGSPPCRDFTVLGRVVGHTWKRPPDPRGEGMRLINAYLDFIEKAKPRYWLMENSSEAVPYVREYRGIEPACIAKLGKTMKRAFWGNHPSFLIPLDLKKGVLVGHRDKDPAKRGKMDSKKYNGWLGPWERARIPLPVSKALAQSVLASKGVEK